MDHRDKSPCQLAAPCSPHLTFGFRAYSPVHFLGTKGTGCARGRDPKAQPRNANRAVLKTLNQWDSLFRKRLPGKTLRCSFRHGKRHVPRDK